MFKFSQKGIVTKDIRIYAFFKTLKVVCILFPIFMILNFIYVEATDINSVLLKVLAGFFMLCLFFYFFYTNNVKKEIGLKSFSSLFHNELLFSFSIDKNGIIQDVNKKIEVYFGVKREYLIGKNVSIFFVENDYKRNEASFSSCLAGETKRCETSVVHPDGRIFDVELMAVPVKVNNKVVSIIGMFHDISDRKKLQEDLKTLANQDGLTGIANRRSFDQTLDEEWEQAIMKEHPLSVILIDIDHFKKYNDLYGHLKGDTCLKTIAKILHDTITVEGGLSARYGGEEFVVILPGIKRTDAVMIANRLRMNIEEFAFPHQGSSTSDCVTISAGVAGYIPKDEEASDSLLELADKALYKAKANGGNQVCIGRVEDKIEVI
ncbi:sensor domain-containing diguanylate cyclase [Aquibacillus rhizosphaerae]|uniref:Sensor domain-containing diguanylate cyclase n=1 Tax=Aquibacillus rhizosphaerae TaxID=3051431 RepID=A0ABT7L5K1_9BACI|nr:sensor domain-containing diguanylate cyclase [Aquibacillus sp. LR5S19]MDL4841143.1 sensor domain-containing diguanylate cyclase [Aquibacillus sp. LR5S19]